MAPNNKINSHVQNEKNYANFVLGFVAKSTWKDVINSLSASLKKLEGLDAEGSLDNDFEIPVEDLEWIANSFIYGTFGDAVCGKKALSVLMRNAPNIDVHMMTSEKHTDFNSPRCDEHIQYVKQDEKFVPIKTQNSEVYLPVARKVSRGVATTNLRLLSKTIHEVGHAIASRNFDAIPQPLKRDEYGEIESMILEKLFMLYLFSSQPHMDAHFIGKKFQPFADGLVGDGILLKSYYERELELLKNQIMRLCYITNPEDVCEIGDTKHTKQFEARYAVGDFFSTLFVSEYLRYPKQSIENLERFLSGSSNMTTISDVANAIIPKTVELASNKARDESKTLYDELAMFYVGIKQNIASNARIIDDYDELR